MRKLVTTLFLGALLFTNAYAKELTFGVPVDPSLKIEISTLMASPEQYVDQVVTVSGIIIGVCEKRGCWMKLASDAKFQNLRIKVKDGDMVFPMSAKGREALATGRFTQIKLDIEQTRKHKAHMAENHGEEFDPASVTEGMSYYQVVPVGVRILD